MHKTILLILTVLVVLGGCSNEKKPNAANFTKAINAYLAKHGQVCVLVDQTFPADVTLPEQKQQTGIGPQTTALEQAGLVRGSNTTAVIHGLAEALSRSTTPQPVRRYELTNEGQKYYRQTLVGFGQTGEFCYGQKAVDSIVRWTEPAAIGPYTQSEVTYIYKVVNLAAWAQQSGIQQAFPDIPSTIQDGSKVNQRAGLVLTNNGWEVPKP
jgi:hypothetical protein